MDGRCWETSSMGRIGWAAGQNVQSVQVLRPDPELLALPLADQTGFFVTMRMPSALVTRGMEVGGATSQGDTRRKVPVRSFGDRLQGWRRKR